MLRRVTLNFVVFRDTVWYQTAFAQKLLSFESGNILNDDH